MIDELEKVGARLVLLPRLESEDEIIEQAADADALIVTESPITRRVLSSFDHCKAVLRTGVGFDCIDVPAATDNGIAVINVPDLWTREVANQAMMLLLAANRKLLEQVRNVTREPVVAGDFGSCRPSSHRDRRDRRAGADWPRFRAAHSGIRGGAYRI